MKAKTLAAAPLSNAGLEKKLLEIVGWGAPKSSTTCWMRLPLPLATRTTLEEGGEVGSTANSFGSELSSSLSVMLSMMHMKRFIRIWLSFSLPCSQQRLLYIVVIIIKK